MAWRDFVTYLLLSYWTVLVAELVGDKSIYTVTSLAMRFRPLVVYGAISAAFLAKMGVAVLFGRLLGRLPLPWTSAISAATFFGSAVWIWRRGEEPRADLAEPPSWLGAAAVSFFAIFLSEWADFGQISAAVLVMRYNAPVAIWLGGSLALCSKGALALGLGLKLRQKVPERWARTLSAVSCLVLGLVSLAGLFPRKL